MLLVSLHLLLFSGTAGAQPCGTGRLHLYVFDSEGRAVDGLTVEILNPESREPFYKGSGGGQPDRQTGRGAQSEFTFPTPPGGGTGRDVTLRYTAPGYLTHEETGAYLMGCETWHAAVLMRSFEASSKGAARPSLVGVVRELFFENVEADYRHGMTPGRPLPGVTVIAEKGREQFSAVTDGSGRYKFDVLPGGEYVVYPILPKTLEPYDTNGFALGGVRDTVTVNTGIKRSGVLTNSPQKHAEGLRGRGLALGVGGGEVAPRADFLALPSGRIGGLVEGVYETNPGMHYTHYLELLCVNPRTNDVEDVPVVRRGYSEPVPSGAGKAKNFRFDIYQVPAGKYVVRLRMQVTPWVDSHNLYFYYPGVDSVERAQVVDFPEGGALTDLSFKLPPLISRQVYGEVMMPDGKLVGARVRIVDAAQPSASREREFLDGRFDLHFFRGRKFHLYAYRDGELDGKPVRYSGQALNQWDGTVRPDAYEGILGPVTIVLNRVESR